MDLATTSILNMADLLARVDDDRELLIELFFIFKSAFPVHLKRLTAAVNLRDARAVKTESHALKGMLLNLAATRAASVATRLEQMGQENECAGMMEALAEFQAEVNLLLAQMDEQAKELQP